MARRDQTQPTHHQSHYLLLCFQLFSEHTKQYDIYQDEAPTGLFNLAATSQVFLLLHIMLCLRLFGLGLLSFCRRSVIELGRWTRDLSADGHNDISECVLYFGSSKYVRSSTANAVACNVLFLSVVSSQKSTLSAEKKWICLEQDYTGHKHHLFLSFFLMMALASCVSNRKILKNHYQ